MTLLFSLIKRKDVTSNGDLIPKEALRHPLIKKKKNKDTDLMKKMLIMTIGVTNQFHSKKTAANVKQRRIEINRA